jgi:hypothetical protein
VSDVTSNFKASFTVTDLFVAASVRRIKYSFSCAGMYASLVSIKSTGFQLYPQILPQNLYIALAAMVTVHIGKTTKKLPLSLCVLC